MGSSVQEFSRFERQIGDMATRSRARILVVDDEENIAYLLKSAWIAANFTVETAATGRTALELVGTWRPDILVLDVTLPDMTGFDILDRLRASGNKVPVVFLTARGDTNDRVRGLSAGADDYVAKPFSLEEVTARVVACLRRAGLATVETRYTIDDLVLDDDAHRVWRGTEEIQLTATEYRLLHLLVANADKVVSRARILEHIWQYDFGGESSIIESFVSNLRKKVDRNGTKLIHTVRGLGYMIRTSR